MLISDSFLAQPHAFITVFGQILVTFAAQLREVAPLPQQG